MESDGTGYVLVRPKRVEVTSRVSGSVGSREQPVGEGPAHPSVALQLPRDGVRGWSRVLDARHMLRDPCACPVSAPPCPGPCAFTWMITAPSSRPAQNLEKVRPLWSQVVTGSPFGSPGTGAGQTGSPFGSPGTGMAVWGLYGDGGEVQMRRMGRLRPSQP